MSAKALRADAPRTRKVGELLFKRAHRLILFFVARPRPKLAPRPQPVKLGSGAISACAFRVELGFKRSDSCGFVLVGHGSRSNRRITTSRTTAAT